ncbi:phosphate/phosphite/phosphonate ABC transporter substrate-binding protein [Saliterribacillus persicus]|uniref:Phosphonate transport system substrate-binding protein n=1 Tax=Saliterribacillus persicus TaxID=930114 RepID=A0A368XRL2_9BACI|nr:phosphate/phosphite/phosphonate ABC transporter substrate-binding protein [Saliterribacillus persicus]RCW69678.1 phosphonate transport system substrate-binding protein [Saliterribacillus persicus]
MRVIFEKTNKFLALMMVVGFISLLAACGDDANASEGDNGDGWPDKISYGVLPGEEDTEISRAHDLFAEDMSEELGIEVELFQGEDYNAVIEAMRSKKLDMASFGPFSYIIAQERSNAVPIAVRAKSEEDATYNSWIVVPDESDAETVEDLKDKTILFADPASTSGHLFPRGMFIDELGITNDEIESYFSSVSFSGSHDNSILAIAAGDADAAGVCSTCVERAIEGGMVSESDFRIIKESDPIPSSPITYRGDLPESLVEAIKEFVYNYDNETYFEKAGDSESRYIPVDESDYDIIRNTAKNLDMSPEDLLSN